MVEQEVHPYNQESALVRLCRSRGVALLAHSPLGSALPEPCPPTGFYCPGAANDETNDPPGSKPIIVSVGAQTATVEVEVVEQQMTLDISIDEYNETAVKVRVQPSRPSNRKPIALTRGEPIRAD